MVRKKEVKAKFLSARAIAGLLLIATVAQDVIMVMDGGVAI
jgi:hypothetical protein